MSSFEDESSGDDSTYTLRPQKRRRTTRRGKSDTPSTLNPPSRRSPLEIPILAPLMEALESSESAFEDLIENHISDWLATRNSMLNLFTEADEEGRVLRSMSRLETYSITAEGGGHNSDTISTQLTKRKLQSYQERRRKDISTEIRFDATTSASSIPLDEFKVEGTTKVEVLDALYAIRSTPYMHSFLSRLDGPHNEDSSGVLSVEYEPNASWISVMEDIRGHYILSHPEREHPEETVGCIQYQHLKSAHIRQVHDLLHRAFWTGIDVSDALQYSPERCTVIVTYKQLVVGAAFLSSPQETYITYLAVRAGWENAHIASRMLYHLITLNPGRDITLHVSANNPAMLLYNKFGFKAEEFIAGFYETYLDPQSRASKNAFRLRLRR